MSANVPNLHLNPLRILGLLAAIAGIHQAIGT
jgi:hypothetical protein